MLKLSEIFTSLQGEGPFAGRPATFIRLSGCLEPFCPWCDTKHAWKAGKVMDRDSIIKQIESYSTTLLVITGGEPYLQWNYGLKELEHSLLNAGYTVHYETSGKLLIPEDSMGYKVCSPKFLKNHWHVDERNIDRTDVFKFVWSDGGESIKDFVLKHRISSDRVWIMPLGSHRSEQLALMASTWEFCVENRFNFSPRLHTLAFDNQKGI